MKRPLKTAILISALLATPPLAVQAQDYPPPQGMPVASAPVAYSQQQLDQMTAPIALYPDQLVGQILMASTYPLEVVEAYRWRQNPAYAQLSGDQLGAALEQQPWAPSVKAVVPFPQVLSMMDNNLQWTEQLGDAFLGNQGAVMDSIQRLRGMAQQAGNLQSTQQQYVSGSPGDIVIVPANPQIVYVPAYNPVVVYGAWPYPAYQPYYFAPAPGYVDYRVGLIGFGVGIGVVDVLWGWDHWDWRSHHIEVDRGRYENLNRGRPPAFAGGAWSHDVSHRHGVPYANPGARAQFQRASDESRRNSRGFEAPAARQENNTVRPAANGRNSTPHQQQAAPAVQQHVNAPVQQQHEQQRPQVQQHQQQTQQLHARQPQTQQRQAPVFESFSRGSDTRAQSERGAYSRSTQPAAQQQHQQQQQPQHQGEQHPANHQSAPAHQDQGQNSGGGHGGNNHNDDRNNR